MIVEVLVVGEGQTEETFTRDVVAPLLAYHDVMVSARLIPTSKHGVGGALKRDRVLRYLRNTLRERDDVYVTTFFDLYALPDDFPGRQESIGIADPLLRSTRIEEVFSASVIQASGCRPEQFIPHIQPYEFETLLFSDVGRVCAFEAAWGTHLPTLRQIREAVATPEYINEGVDTHPYARLTSVLGSPRYNKVLHGALITEDIGLDRIRAECRHFGAWLDRILALADEPKDDDAGTSPVNATED